MDYLGRLSMIDLSDEEWLQVADDMKSLLEYVDKLQELDTTHVEPLSHVLPLKNAFREEVVAVLQQRLLRMKQFLHWEQIRVARFVNRHLFVAWLA